VFNTVHRATIIAEAARHRVPAIYSLRFFALAGGLISYGIDNIDVYRRAASYVARILGGARPANLPVQLPSKFECVINLTTAKGLGLPVTQGFGLSPTNSSNRRLRVTDSDTSDRTLPNLHGGHPWPKVVDRPLFFPPDFLE